MLKEIGSVFSFLTIFPSSNGTLENIAKYMFMFPIVGIIIGLLIGSLGFGLSFILEPLLVSLLVVASIAIVTGIHHADGLADFADGLMVKGTKDKKLQAMKDLSTGSALFKAILISEILAKFSMVLMASLGKSASLGSNSPFVEFMKDKKKLSAAFLIMLIPVILIGEITGMIMLGVTIALTLFLLAVSTRSFGGITGDVLGATNEFTRLASLMVFVSI
jgi:adenosylcobinamide-GDP ribazoletransferase